MVFSLMSSSSSPIFSIICSIANDWSKNGLVDDRIHDAVIFLTYYSKDSPRVELWWFAEIIGILSFMIGYALGSYEVMIGSGNSNERIECLIYC